jgi:hypothetical protein
VRGTRKGLEAGAGAETEGDPTKCKDKDAEMTSGISDSAIRAKACLCVYSLVKHTNGCFLFAHNSAVSIHSNDSIHI